MPGLVPPTRAEAFANTAAWFASAGEGPGIHDFSDVIPAKAGILTRQRLLLLDCPVEPGNDKDVDGRDKPGHDEACWFANG
jgi:hypothetical protein